MIATHKRGLFIDDLGLRDCVPSTEGARLLVALVRWLTFGKRSAARGQRPV
jgi:hypothetical protein